MNHFNYCNCEQVFRDLLDQQNDLMSVNFLSLEKTSNIKKKKRLETGLIQDKEEENLS